jgi:hypothetical protein
MGLSSFFSSPIKKTHRKLPSVHLPVSVDQEEEYDSLGLMGEDEDDSKGQELEPKVERVELRVEGMSVLSSRFHLQENSQGTAGLT